MKKFFLDIAFVFFKKETVTEDVGSRWFSIGDAASQVRDLLSDEHSWREKSNRAVEKAKLFSPEKFRQRVVNVLSEAGILV